MKKEIKIRKLQKFLNTSWNLLNNSHSSWNLLNNSHFKIGKTSNPQDKMDAIVKHIVKMILAHVSQTGENAFQVFASVQIAKTAVFHSRK